MSKIIYKIVSLLKLIPRSLASLNEFEDILIITRRTQVKRVLKEIKDLELCYLHELQYHNSLKTNDNIHLDLSQIIEQKMNCIEQFSSTIKLLENGSNI